MPKQVKHPDCLLGRPDTRRFVQERFAISFWVDPPAEEDMDARYKEIAEANFSLVLGGFGARTPMTGAL
ncbi:hypothetical protein FJZ31_34365 [Candidatus Poribacteria bacterium]|nr:hypothetical protein [Candidatus Poribacteria bacterium]